MAYKKPWRAPVEPYPRSVLEVAEPYYVPYDDADVYMLALNTIYDADARGGADTRSRIRAAEQSSPAGFAHHRSRAKWRHLSPKQWAKQWIKALTYYKREKQLDYYRHVPFAWKGNKR